jgi:hypothetical protein
MFKLLLLPLVTVIVAVLYLYPSSIVHIIRNDEIPSNPHYPYYLILYPGEILVGTISNGASIAYIEIRGEIYDRWEPRVIARDALGNCTFNVEGVICKGAPVSFVITTAHIVSPPIEVFNVSASSTPLYLARAYEKTDREKSLQLYRAYPDLFFARYRIAVLTMDMGAFLSVYHAFPHRKEPLYYLARHYRTIGNYSECLIYARTGMLVGSPVDGDTFIEKPIYMYGLELEFAHCLYHSGRPKEAINQWKRVLPVLPETLKNEIKQYILG